MVILPIRKPQKSGSNIDTPLHKDDDHGFLSNMHPIARMGQAYEIVDAIMYLNAATFVTGEIVFVDGGAHAGKW
jgi:NAD(P)-dependent dehydrogenase (short-subunit alcohol dehydrogenase family)